MTRNPIMARDAIDVRELSVVFPRTDGDITALSKVSISFSSKCRTAIVGESGSGKSILAAAILGLLPSSARVTGSIRANGQELIDAPPAVLENFRARIAALVPQSPLESLNPVMPVRTQLSEGVSSKNRRSSRAGATVASWVDHALGLVGFPPRADRTHRFAHQLSGGLAQRAVVAGALARNPQWIIADEPTKGLDASLRLRCCLSIADACETAGSGLMVITHDLDVARFLSDSVVVMYGGEIVEEAPTEQFFANPAHPYSQGLLASSPERGLHPIPGDPPPALMEEFRCRFAVRCPFAQQQCVEHHPALRWRNKQHLVRCVLYPAGTSTAKGP